MFRLHPNFKHFSSFTLGTSPFQDKIVKKPLEAIFPSYASYESTHSIPDKNIPAPVLIVHGLCGSKSNWNSLCKMYLNKTVPKRKLFAIDLRNHGDNMHSPFNSYEHLVLDLLKFVQSMEISRVQLIGHSIGGRAAMLFSLKYPDLVEKLIVAEISPISTSATFRTMPILLKRLINLKMPKNIPLSNARKLVLNYLLPIVHNHVLLAFLLTNLVQLPNGSFGWRMNIPAILNNYHHIASFPVMHNITYSGPVLFIGGANSDFIHKSDLPHILKLFPQAELKFIEGAGHWLHSEKPQEFLKLTLDFLNK